MQMSQRYIHFVLMVIATVATTAMSSASPPEYGSSSTPLGITLVDVVREQYFLQPQYLWTRLGDEHGNPLYASESNDADTHGKCDESCTKKFLPVLASRSAKPFAKWTVIARSDGTRQWAYEGKALYRYPEADPRFLAPQGLEYEEDGANAKPGDTAPPMDSTIIPTFSQDSDDIHSKLFSPAPGWRIVAYEPEQSLQIPNGIATSEVQGANGRALIDAAGFTLYARVAGKGESCNGNQYQPCFGHWHALRAPQLAMPVGDFSIVHESDGTPQWAFRGKRLYRFDGDHAAGDANGIGVESNMEVALVSRDFMPPGVQISLEAGRGYILTTGNNVALYERHTYHYMWGGRNSHDGFRSAWRVGKLLGVGGCDTKCLTIWHPLQAPQDAHSSGYWEVASRPDGSKQWVYRGYALYTYSGDKKPGDVNGSNLYDIIVGDHSRYSMADAGGGHTSGAGLIWRVANPY
jgi:predicted lipoprotein with Yx(FWY)xxD motif